MTPARFACRLPRRIGMWAQRRLCGDSGFALLESVVAISLITIIMAAVGVEYVNGLSSTSRQRAQTTAIQVADTAVEGLRALHASDLLKGRDKISVTSEYNTLAAIPAVGSWLSTSTANIAYDNSVTTGGATAAVPTVAVTQKPGTIAYRMYDYLECSAATSTGSCTSTSAAVNYVRAIVAVVWTQRGCPSNTCSYTTSTLINADGDPTFDLNQPLPAAPEVQDPGAQTVAVSDSVSLQLKAQNGKGVAPFTWTLKSGSLPNGLAISPAGLISGTVQGSAGTASSVIQLTDAFLRTTSVTINWTIKPPLTWVQQSGGTTAQPIPDQASLTTSTVNLTVSATGGSGSGYTYSDPNGTLPPGVSLSASTGKITGTPAPPAPRTYNVQLTVTDSSGTRTATTSFTWSVNYPPLGVTDPGSQTGTVGIADTLQLAATGGDQNYTWNATGLPAGLSFNSTTGKITGTPTATGTSSVTATVSDPSAGMAPQQVTFNWTVYKAPTIVTPGNQKDTKGDSVNLAITATCPNTPCSYSISGQPTNVVINPSTGVITGTPSATGTYSVVVTVTDNAGAKASTNSFTWTIYAAPTLSGLAAHSSSEGALDNAAIVWTCPYTSCVLNLSGAVPGIGLETTANDSGNNSSDTSLTVSGTSGTVYLTGTVQNTAVTSGTSKAYNLNLTITDGGGYKPPASTATWTAHVAPTISGLTSASYARSSSPSQALSYTCRVATCTIGVSGVPGGLSNIGLDDDNSGTNVQASITVPVGSGTVYLRGTISSSATRKGYSITVTITDGNGASGTASATWTVTS